MSSLAGSSRCRVERARADVKLTRLGSMSSRVGPGQCRIELARVDVRVGKSLAQVKLSGPRPMPDVPECMLSRAGLGRCQVERAWDDLKLNGLESMSS